MIERINIYTDGACKGNPGPGGWGALLQYKDTEKELCGGEANTTNNRMELLAVIMALQALTRPSSVFLYTDSKYVMDGATLYMQRWQQNGWHTTAKKPIKNQDLWRRLNAALSPHQVQWHWVKGHNGNFGNERADLLANKGITAV